MIHTTSGICLLKFQTPWTPHRADRPILPHEYQLNTPRRKPNVVKMLDQLSPVAPARVRVVLLPIGQIKRARFLRFVERLHPENVVRLGDISPDGRPNRSKLLRESCHT